MSPEIKASKQALRREMAAALQTMVPAEREAASGQARRLLASRPEWKAARSVLFYAPMTGELDVWPLLEDALAGGKKVGLPRYAAESGTYMACEVRDLETDLKTGHFGIREPAGHCAAISLKLDLILVPGVAFDLHGRRLGRGKGFYDQLLAGLRGVMCGVAFDQQIARKVPVTPRDIRMNRILTPTRWVDL
ncbi:MAG: 5-formyltetrahydrofolate cyclo-ligase [Limisphaerales bacterium]